MPRIPQYERQQGLGAGPTAARVDPRMFATGGENIARIGEMAAQFADARMQARNEADLVRAKAQASRELLNLQLEMEQDTDWRTMDNRFAERVKEIQERVTADIADPGIRQNFALSFEELAGAKSVAVRRRSWDLESNQARADLDTVLTDNARFAANAGSGAEVARHLKDGLDAIDRLAAAGYISPEDAGKRRTRFLGDHDEAKVLGLINTTPAEAEKRLADPAQFQHLDPERRQRLYSQAATRADAMETRRLREMEKAERQAEKAQRQRGEELAKQGWDLALGGGLTEEWLAANKPDMEPSDYRAFRKALSDPNDRPDNAKTYGELVRGLYVEGKDVRSDALAAFNRHEISAATLKTILDENQGIQGKSGPQTPYERGKAFIANAMRYSDVNPLPGQPQAMANAVADFDAWAAKNPNASPEQAMAYARDTVKGYSLVNWQSMSTSMRTPLHFKGSRAAPDMDATKRALHAAFKKGEITEARLADELHLVRQWEEAIEIRKASQTEEPKGKSK